MNTQELTSAEQEILIEIKYANNKYIGIESVIKLFGGNYNDKSDKSFARAILSDMSNRKLITRFYNSFGQDCYRLN
jgi:hypothetical protein